jgi:hypothetical protein
VRSRIEPCGALVVAAAMLLATGCATEPVAVCVQRDAVAVAPLLEVSTLLLSAEDDEDEFVGLLTQPEPQTEVAVVTSGGATFGVRAGVLSPMAAAKGTWSSGLRAGAYLRGGSAKKFEIGLDYSRVEADYDRGATVSSTIVSGRFDILFGSWDDPDKNTVLYFLGGGEVGQESGTWDATGEALDAMGGAGNVGVGLGSSTGSWDARAVYSILAGDNVSGLMSVSFGYGF